MSIGKNIRHFRKEKHMTQKELGNACGINEVQIRRYELENATPRMESVEKIAKALQVSPSKLLGYHEDFSWIDLFSGSTDICIDDALEDLNTISDKLTEAFYQMYISEERIRKSALKALIEMLEQLNIDGMNDLLEYANSLTFNESYQSTYFNNDKMMEKFKKIKNTPQTKQD